MSYKGVKFSWEKDSLSAEVLIAYIDTVGFESFEEGEKELKAYIQSENFKKTILDECLTELKGIRYEVEEIEDQNWNAVWESNYDPVHIKDECYIRAPFHDAKPEYKYEIIIEPQMSFGTAHHETTAMILEYILESDFEGKTVLDMGCGTAVLAILAAMKGADKLTAIDFDEWAYRNSLENVERNEFQNIDVIHGDANAIPQISYETIFANINRNILLADMHSYVAVLKDKGDIFFSGFYLEDLKHIQEKAESLGLKFIDHKHQGKWIAARFTKIY